MTERPAIHLDSVSFSVPCREGCQGKTPEMMPPQPDIYLNLFELNGSVLQHWMKACWFGFFLQNSVLYNLLISIRIVQRLLAAQRLLWWPWSFSWVCCWHIYSGVFTNHPVNGRVHKLFFDYGTERVFLALQYGVNPWIWYPGECGQLWSRRVQFQCVVSHLQVDEVIATVTHPEHSVLGPVHSPSFSSTPQTGCQCPSWNGNWQHFLLVLQPFACQNLIQSTF